MLTGVKTFLKDLSREAAHIEGPVRQEFIREIGELIFTLAKEGTPIVSGHLESEWRISLDLDETFEEGPRGEVRVTPLSEIAKLDEVSDIYRIVNPSNYASYVEYGSPKNVPRLMLTKAVLAAENVVLIR